MKRFLTALILIAASMAAPASAQLGAAPPPQQQQSATSAQSRTSIAGRFSLDLATSDQGLVDRVGETPTDSNAPPALSDRAAAQARTTAPLVQLPAPSAITQPQQVKRDPRVSPNP